MKTRPKDLGTRTESAVVRAAQAAGLISERLAEGAAYDRGDVRILTDREWVLEVRDRQQMNVHQALERALLKSGTPDTAVVWRKMRRVNGNSRRTQDGPVIVAMTLDRYLELLKDTT